MTQLTEPTVLPLHQRVLTEARTVCDEARRDKRAVSGAVAALGVGLLLGVFLKPSFADGETRRSTANGVESVEPGLVSTEGLDILVSARPSEEGRLPRVHTRLDAPVFGDPGPAPRLQRVSHIVEPEEEGLLEDDPEPLFIAPPRLDGYGAEDPDEHRADDLEPL